MNKIHCLPTNPKPYVVATLIDGELWYQGSYEILSEADKQAEFVDGFIYLSDTCAGY